MIKNRTLAVWLVAVAAVAAGMVVSGGWVHSVRPVLAMAAWNAAVGLALVVPLAAFAARGTIPGSRLPAFALVVGLAVLQGLCGWLVASPGPSDAPGPGLLALSLHLATSLLLAGACLWLGLGYAIGQPDVEQPRVSGGTRRLAVGFLTAHAAQMLTGGLMAGLGAGRLSATFPRMFGQWLPDGLWRLTPWHANLVLNPTAVHFQHRWFAFVVLAVAVTLARRARAEIVPSYLRIGGGSCLHLTLLQVVLGIGLVVRHVPIWMATVHRGVAMAAFAAALLVCHRAFRA